MPNIKPELLDPFSVESIDDPIVPHLLDFLNAGGLPQAIAKVFSQHRRDLVIQDMTGDGIPEIGVFERNAFILGCNGGQYRLLLQWLETGAPNPNSPHIYAVEDMNRDGRPEIVFYFPDSCGMLGRCSSAAVYEWDGLKFRSLSADLAMPGPYSVEVNDIDGDSNLELLLEGGIPGWPDFADGIPWREQTDVYRWDGERFSLYRTTYSAPKYRFQAVQDADELMRWNGYDQALVMYQQVITNSSLDWWTVDRQRYLWDAADRSVSTFSTPAPTPLPLPQPDPAEFPNLAAYARYRIMLIHLVRGSVSDAQASYTLLQRTYQPGQPGYLYVELAKTVLDGFIQTNSLGAACRQGASFADAHSPDILKYLGDLPNDPKGYHGWQGHRYAPSDLCPFK